MKRFTLVLAALAAMIGFANLAIAGDYHVGRTLVCSDCHIAHGSQSHEYTSDNPAAWLGPHTSDPPYPKLLRGETFSNACLNCHDGEAGTPDVLQAPTDVLTHGRSAGALNVPNGGEHGYAQVAPYSQGDGHTLWSTATPPGFTNPAGTGPPLISADGLQCTDCHRAHGAKYFRNMMGDVATSTATYINSTWRTKEVTYEIGAAPSTNPASVWVLEKTPHNYDNDNVQYTEVNQTDSEYGEWCSNCHGNFHGNTTSTNIEVAGEVVRHPTAGVDMVSGTTPFTSWANTDPTRRLKVMSASGAWATTAAAMPTDMTPSCFTCHKSHGNANKFGLIFVMPNASSSAPAGSDPSLIDPVATAMTEEGTGGQYRDMCRNCHGMGRWPTGNPTNILP